MSDKATWPNDEIRFKLQMMVAGRLSWLQTRARLLAFVWVVLLVQVLELLLLERKYDLFTGGFLQPHSYLGLKERAVFFGLSLWMDLVLYGGVAWVWFRLASRWKNRPLLAAYNFAFLMSAAIGVWLAVKFKVLSYFNDTLNFLLVKKLGGDSLFEALAYVANEAAIFGVAVVVLVVAYWIGLRQLRQISPSEPPAVEKRGISVWALLGVLGITVVLVQWISSDAALRYGLQKKTSYALISTTLNKLTDIDQDGYAWFAFPKDPAPLDPLVYPGALDRPGNGIDEDGYGGDFQWSGSGKDALEGLPPIAGDNIVLIVLESARHDLLGQILEGREVAPFMNAMAREGTSPEYVYSHVGYTVPALKALFNRTLSEVRDRVLLTDYLKRSGYRLSFISGQDESFGGVDVATGMSDPGNYLFDARATLDDRVFPSKAPASLRLSEDRVVAQFISRSGEVDWEQPQFFYINLQAAHFPYHNPVMPAILNHRPIPRSEINEDNRTWLANTYWNAIAVADRAVGQIVERLKALGVLEHTVIMILGDHGESLFDDHYLGHGHALNETQTRIPLVINRPGLDLHCALGQVDLAEVLVEVATDRFTGDVCPASDRPVLQLVGTLDNPALVGIVSFGEVRTILDLRTRLVFFSDLKRWEPFATAFDDPQLATRTRTLIGLWEAARWRNHLSRRRVGDGANRGTPLLPH